MLPAVQDINIYQGDTWEAPFRLKKADNTYQDFTGWTVRAHIRTSPTAATPLVEMTATIATTTITLSLTPAQTAALPAAGGQWDLELTTPAAQGSKVRTYLRGNVKVMEELTK